MKESISALILVSGQSKVVLRFERLLLEGGPPLCLLLGGLQSCCQETREVRLGADAAVMRRVWTDKLGGSWQPLGAGGRTGWKEPEPFKKPFGIIKAERKSLQRGQEERARVRKEERKCV